MIEIENIGNEAVQRHVILFEETEIILTLRFLPMVSIWIFNIEYKGRTANGFKLSTQTPHMLSQNFPFDFIVTDNNGTGLDPIDKNDFLNGRCSLYMLEPDDIEKLRGQPVEI